MTSPPARFVMPRLFISDSHDSREHEDRVLALANRLREDGIDTVIDQYDLATPDGSTIWAEREIRKADFIAPVCTGTYLGALNGEMSLARAEVFSGN
jgi:hypothetical protein